MEQDNIMEFQKLEYKNVLEDKYSKIRLEILYDLMKPFIKQSVKILDIGCYTGDLLKFLPSSVDYYGIDDDEKALQIAQKRGAKTIKLNLENEQIPLGQQFDIIIAAEVLEHLKDPEKLILQVKHLLKEDGVVLISLPNECTIYHRLKVLFGKGIDGTGFAPHYHLHFPTIKQNNEFIGRYFEIIKKHYWVHLGTGKMEKILSVIPFSLWQKLVNLFPSLLARGVIYLCQLK